MVSLTDDDKTQLGQLVSYLSTHQATIVDQWLTKHSLDEALQPLVNRSRQAFRNQLLHLFDLLIQRMKGGSQASDLGTKVGHYGLYLWQGSYSLAERIMAVDSFSDVLDEQIQQFLERYPQTQPRVIAQVYSQVHQLSTEVNRDSITHVDEAGQTEPDELLQTLQAALYSLQQLNKQRANHLQQVAHDLRSSYGILFSSVGLLQRPLKNDDRVKYMDMFNRHVNVTQHLLDQLFAYAQSEKGSDS